MATDKVINIRIEEEVLLKLKDKCENDEVAVGQLVKMFLYRYLSGEFGIAFGKLISLPPAMKGMDKDTIERNLMDGKDEQLEGKR